MKKFASSKLLSLFALATTTLLCGCATSAIKPAGAALPKGYRLLYAQDFQSPTALNDFVATDAAAWKLVEENGNTAMELTQQSKYAPAVRSPVNIALIGDLKVGDFILEADLIQTGREYGHRDMCLFFGFQNPSKFYYTHIATAADPKAHNVFLVKDAPRTNIAKKTTKGVNWGLNVWHKVRLERSVAAGTIKVYFDDMAEPLMIAEDKNFGEGHLGFGSFDDTGRVDNIRVWGPSSKSEKVPPFPKK